MEVKRIFHVWFSTKARKPLLQAEIADEVKGSFTRIAARVNIKLLEFELSLDHVHMLLEFTSDQDLPAMMHQLKGACSREVFLKFPELKVDLGHQAFWQKGYGFRQLQADEVRGLRYYVRTQSKRPLRHS
ncbi:MAG: IS200/IS605 family transposase [Dehalococcoidia bacterium]|jgi:putative transposase